MYLILTLKFLLIFIIILSACDKKLSKDDIVSDIDLNSYIESVPTVIVPTPKADYAVVFGRIIDKETERAPQQSIYLATNITANKPDLPDYLSFSYETSPRAIIDDNGFFYFQNVPAGQYAILLFVPGGNPIFIDNGKTDDTMDYLWVNAVPGETLDMGTIVVP